MPANNDQPDSAQASLPAWPDIVTVAGEDAERFLQAQLTCDVTQAEPGACLPFAWCTPAGRMRAGGWLLRGDAVFFLLLGAGCSAGVAGALGKFILRDRVAIDTGQWAITSEPLPAGEMPRHRLQLPGTPAPRFMLASGPVAGDAANTFWLSAIRSGTCALPAGLENRFIPQMLNLDLVAGVSFTKGCYPGQEIVARTHNLGRVKRRMLRFSSATPPAPAATPVFAGGEEIGQVVVAAAVAAGSELLAVIKLDKLDPQSLCLGAPAGAAMRHLTLPYDIPEISWPGGSRK